LAAPSLKDILYYQTGGRCLEFVEPKTIAELAAAVKRLNAAGIPFIPVGAGTNSLFMDEDYRGAVISFRKLDKLIISGTKIQVGAGIDNTLFAETVFKAKLAGAGWMNRLPGQIGGTVRMNARCYGGEISQIVREVTVVSRAGDVVKYTEPKTMFRGYKDTIFMTNGDLVCEVVVELRTGEMNLVREKMDFCANDRIKKGQFTYPSCGCVFKNDYSVGVSSGMLLEEAKVKLLKHAGAEVSPSHANFVFNKGASARAILELSLMMREAVWTKFGVWLEYEMEILGAVPKDLEPKVLEKRRSEFNLELLAPLRERMKASQLRTQTDAENLNSV
jgi:UDP-N-acetylmuramate dehydrogenase